VPAGTGAGLPVDELEALLLEAGQGGGDVGNANRNVMEPRPAAIDEAGHAPFRIEGLDEFELSDEGGAHALVGEILDRGTSLPCQEFIGPGRFPDRGCGDRDVIDGVGVHATGSWKRFDEVAGCARTGILIQSRSDDTPKAAGRPEMENTRMAETKHVIVVGDDSFTEVIEGVEGLALVDFWAPWCGPCRIVGPIVEQLAEDYADKGVKVGKLDVDENPRTASRFGIRSIPSILFFKNGQHVDTVVGAVPKDHLEKKVQEHL
jgi:thioredoxin 1